MNTCPFAAGKEIRDAAKTVFCSRHFSIGSLIFYHVNEGSRFLRNADGPLPRCIALDHIILYCSSLPIPKLQFLLSAYYNLLTTENIMLKELRLWMAHNDENLTETGRGHLRMIETVPQTLFPNSEK
jgi:hypothetical protein